MKRLMTVLAAAGFVACAVSAQTITSVNAVGFHSVDVPPGGDLVLVAPTLEAMGGNTLDDLIGDQMVDDSLAYIWRRDTGAYEKAGKDAKNGWADVTLERGDAVWLTSPTATTTQRVSLAGEVPDVRNLAATTTISIVGIDAVAYPYPHEIDFTNTTLIRNSMDEDKVYFWDAAAQEYVKAAKDSKSGWGPMETKVLGVGEAFWFMPSSGSAEWTEVIKYDLSSN